MWLKAKLEVNFFEGGGVILSPSLVREPDYYISLKVLKETLGLGKKGL